MERNATLLAARGLTDEQDRLLSADGLLADLHERCGGRIPGTLAVPELLDLVRQGREMGLRLAREFHSFDGEQNISGFVRVHPLPADAGGGCELLVENWRSSPLSADIQSNAAARLDAIDRSSAEINIRLDREQRVQLLLALPDDAKQLDDMLSEKPGVRWTDLIQLVGVAHQQPLHWRLLDGAQCKVPGSERDWRTRLMPLGSSPEAPVGFELLLISDQPLGVEHVHQGEDIDPPQHAQMIGSALTPALRQPVARIIANAETIRSKLAGPIRQEYSEYAGNIASAGQHLTAMLEDLGDLEVVEAPGFSTIRERVDLGDVARRAGGILGVRAQARNITLNLPEPGDKRVAAAEFRRVLQILINLIGNAIAYSPEGSTVEVFLVPADPDQVAIEVRDQGDGVDDEQAGRIFEKFERLGREDDTGSGLGLYISRRLANAMDGELELVSSAGEGARFRLTLPAMD
ncbi:MAG: HAMP domain-containing sensor histidine kinase [Pseudomonadota bacterium]